MIFINLYAMGTQPSAIFDIFRYLFFFIDGIIYSIIPLVYSLIFHLYDIYTLFNDNGAALSKLVQNLSTTIYSFLAIAMFFRTAVSLLTMLVDPSKIGDKEKGASKIIINIFICLILVIAVPKLFEASRKIQTRIMENHVIEKMVLGEDFGDNEKYTLGHEISLSLWSVFINPYNANSITQGAYDSVFNNQDAVGIGAIWPVTKLLVVLNSVDGIPILADIVGKLIPDLNNILNIFDAGTHYQLSYVWLLSTIVGGYVLWTFIKMMIDIAYRSIKFFALEILSPIAIISYIDPSSSKKGLFNKWMNETIKTYLSLFIRIFTFAIATVLLRAFNLSDMSSNSLMTWTGNIMVVKLFYILAAVAFFKNAPKFIDSLFGTKMSQDSDTKFAKSLLSSVVGSTTSAAIGGISGAAVAKRSGNNVGRGAWEGIKKGFSGGWKAGQTGGIKGMTGVVQSGIAGRDAAGKYFGVKTGADARKDEHAREVAGQLSDQYEDFKARSGYKAAIEGARDSAQYSAAVNRAATEIDDSFAQSEYGFAAGSTSANNIKKLAKATSAHKQDKSLMIERAKVFDAISANNAAVAAGHMTRDEADRLNLQTVLNYNKLAAQKDMEHAIELEKQASEYATQLRTMPKSELYTRVNASADQLYDEYVALQAKPNRDSIEENRMNLIASSIDVSSIEEQRDIKTRISNGTATAADITRLGQIYDIGVSDNERQLYNEYMSISVKAEADRTDAEKDRMQVISQSINLSNVQAEIEFENRVNSGTATAADVTKLTAMSTVGAKIDATAETLVDTLSKRTQRSEELRDARSNSAKTNVQYDKAKGAVDSWLETNEPGAEYYKGLKKGEKIRGR